MQQYVQNFILSLAQVAVVALPLFPVHAIEPDLCAVATQALKDAQTIRKLQPRRDVPCQVAEKTAIEGFLHETLKTKLPPNKILMEQTVYRALGFVPDTYNYEKGMIDLYANQIGGYYDPEKKHFIMARWIPAALQYPVAVHELTHALQDQTYDLEHFLDPKLPNGDQLLAYSALIEGDATAVMSDWQRLSSRQPPLEREQTVDSLIMQQVLGSALMMGGGNTPEALQALMIFPYTSGLRFVHTLLRQGGYAKVDAAFKRPPTSSREILHPEVYFGKGPATQIPKPEALVKPTTESAKLEYTDTLGEFGISALLCSQSRDKKRCADAAAGWIGDLVGVFKDGDLTTISWLTAWENDKEAQEFEAAYRSFVEARYHKQFTGEEMQLTDKKLLRLRREGAGVTLLFTMR
jgi:hypothetical protein